MTSLAPVGAATQKAYSNYAQQSYGCGSNFDCQTTQWYGYGCAGWGAGWGFGIGLGIGWSSCGWGAWWGYSGCWNWCTNWCVGFGWGAYCGWGAPYYACYYPYYSYPYYRYPYYSSYYPSYYGGGYGGGYAYDDGPSTVIYADSVVVDDGTAYVTPEEGAAPSAGGVDPAPAAAPEAPLDARARDLHSRELELAQKYVNLGDLYFRSGRYPAAVDAYARAVELAPEDAALQFILSDAQFAAGDYAAASNSIRRALARDPELAHLKADKRKFYADPAVFAEQLGRLEGHVQKNPLDGDAFLVLGYNLAYSDQAEEARTALERARRLQPSDPAIAAFLTALLERELEAAGAPEKREEKRD